MTRFSGKFAIISGGASGMGVAAAISSLVVLLHFTVNIFLASRKFDIKIPPKRPSYVLFGLIRNILFFPNFFPTK